MNKLLQFVYRKKAKFYGDKLLPLIKENSKVLDIGAGRGFVSEYISKKANVTLSDTVDYNCTRFPLILYDGKKLPFRDKSFDTGLLIAVLHHAPNPKELLKESQRVCKKLIIIEEVYRTSLERKWLKFYDWFWNLSFWNLKGGISMNYNFNTDEQWKKIFSELKLERERDCNFKNPLKTMDMKMYILKQNER